MSYGWDVCPCAEIGCAGARDSRQFHRTCLNCYDNCEKYQDARMAAEGPRIDVKEEFEDLGKANSSINAGAYHISSNAFPNSPSPKQTPHFSVEYKSEGLGDLEEERGAFWGHINAGSVLY